jgi:hypothetical protein
VPLRSVWFNYPSTGWIVGDNGTVLRTTTDGRSWFPMDSRTTQPLYGVVFTDTAHGWTVGQDGCIMHAKITPPGVAEQDPAPPASHPMSEVTFVRGVLMVGQQPTADGSRPELLDVAGRRVAELHAGANDVSRLAPGVCFVTVNGVRSTVYARKVVIQR